MPEKWFLNYYAGDLSKFLRDLLQRVLQDRLQRVIDMFVPKPRLPMPILIHDNDFEELTALVMLPTY